MFKLSTLRSVYIFPKVWVGHDIVSHDIRFKKQHLILCKFGVTLIKSLLLKISKRKMKVFGWWHISECQKVRNVVFCSTACFQFSVISVYWNRVMASQKANHCQVFEPWQNCHILYSLMVLIYSWHKIMCGKRVSNNALRHYLILCVQSILSLFRLIFLISWITLPAALWFSEKKIKWQEKLAKFYKMTVWHVTHKKLDKIH